MAAARKQKWLNAFVPHRLEMLLSPAWQLAPRPLGRIIERLEIEHLRHGGYENGHLYVSYQQIVKCGVSKKSIKTTLELGQKLGLIKIIQDHELKAGEGRGVIRPANRYALTYLPEKGKSAPSDDWKKVPREQAEAFIAAAKASEPPRETYERAVA